MSNANKRIEEMLVQMREMRLTPEELEAVVDNYKDHSTLARAVIHTAATMLLLEVAFAE